MSTLFTQSHLRWLTRLGMAVGLWLGLLIIAAPAFAAGTIPGDFDPRFGPKRDGQIMLPFASSDPGSAAKTVTLQQSDGMLLIGGSAVLNAPAQSDFVLSRLTSDGLLDGGFGSSFNDTFSNVVTGTVAVDFSNRIDTLVAVAVQADGKIVLVGQTSNGTSIDFAIARLTTAGALDTSFNGTGKVTLDINGGDDIPVGVVIQADGGIVVAGTSAVAGTSNGDFAVARFTSAGALDTTGFASPNGFRMTGIYSATVKAVALDSNQNILVAGTASDDFALARLTTAGALDTSFGATGLVTVTLNGTDDLVAMELQPNGKILLAGEAVMDTNPAFAVVRYNTNGTLDTSFDTDGKVILPNFYNDPSVSAYAYDMLVALGIQTDGKIVLGGTIGNSNLGSTEFGVARLTSAGALDTSFDTDGLSVMGSTRLTNHLTAMVVESDGKIAVAGVSDNTQGTAQYFQMYLITALGAMELAQTSPIVGSGGNYLYAAVDVNHPVAMIVRPDERFVLAGTMLSTTTSTYYFNVISLMGEVDYLSNLNLTNDGPTLLPATTRLTATLSTGTQEVFTWNFGHGVVITTSEDLTRTFPHLFPAGNFNVLITATNSLGELYAQTNVTVNDRLITGLVMTTSAPTSLTSATFFTATVYTGTSVIFNWNYGDGTPIELTAFANMTHTFPAIGTFSVTVTATNSLTPTAVFTNVTIVDVPIIGLAVANSTPAYLSSPTFFTATVVTGTTVLYDWNFGDGTFGSGRLISHTYTALGSYFAVVTATNSLTPAVLSTRVNVLEAPITGLAAASSSPTSIGSPTYLTATIATGSRVTYTWDFGDGTALGSGVTLTHTYAALNSYTATVTATNSLGSVFTSTVVEVTDQAITGLTAVNSSPHRLGVATYFTATITTGTNVAYSWNFGDGTALDSGVTVSHTYAALANYTATLTATNSLGSVFTTTLVIISGQAITGLVASNTSPTLIGQATDFSASVATGDNVSYAWNFGDGTALGSGATPSHTYLTIGQFTVIVTATNSVNSVFTTTTVTVKPYALFLPFVQKSPAASGLVIEPGEVNKP